MAKFAIFLLSVLTLFIQHCLGTICLGSSTISNNKDDVGFYLYKNPADLDDADELVYNDTNSVSTSRYNNSLPVILLTHGFSQTYKSQFPYYVKKGYLDAGYSTKANLIAVDWGKLSGQADPNGILPELLAQLPDYICAVKNVPIVGERIKEFLIFLIRGGFLSGPEKVHLVGQSLGAHVSGMAGMKFQQVTSTKIARITGTDPAGPLFQLNGVDDRLDETDADFVDIIHVNAGVFGYAGSLGNVDFVVNGGIFQLSCLTNLTDLFCSHNLAPRYFAQSIPDDSTITGDKWVFLTKSSIRFGEHCPTTATGTYEVEMTLAT